MNTLIMKPNFRTLPAGLRSLMYAEMSPPLRNHIDQYHSIVLSCKELKADVEGEIVHHMLAFLTTTMKAWGEMHTSPLQIKMPTTLSLIKHVAISLPKSVLRLEDGFRKTPAAS